MKKVLSVLLMSMFLGLMMALMGCAVYPSPGCNNNEILATKAMAARTLMLEMEQREPVNWHCVPGYQSPVAHPAPMTSAAASAASASASAAAAASATSYAASTVKAAPSVVQGIGDYIIDISSDGNNLLVAVDARLIRQPRSDEKMYFVGNFSNWRPSDNNEMKYNTGTNCWEATIPLMGPGDYQGNTTLQIAGTELQTADSFWAAVHKSGSKWVKINPSTQKGSINFRIEGDNIEPGPGI